MTKENYTADKYRVAGENTTTKGKFIGILIKDNSSIVTCGHHDHDSKKEAASCMRDIATKQYHFNVTN